MHRVTKAIVGATMIVGLLGGSAAAAKAAVILGAAPSGFVPVAFSDSAFISHDVGRTVINTDPNGTHNVVANLGVAKGAASTPFAIRGSNSNAAVEMKCWIIQTNANTGIEVAVQAVTWASGESGIKNFSPFSLDAVSSYTFSAFCALPAATGTTRATLYGVWSS